MSLVFSSFDVKKKNQRLFRYTDIHIGVMYRLVCDNDATEAQAAMILSMISDYFQEMRPSLVVYS